MIPLGKIILTKTKGGQGKMIIHGDEISIESFKDCRIFRFNGVHIWMGDPTEEVEAERNQVLSFDTYKRALNQVFTEAKVKSLERTFVSFWTTANKLGY
jgi:hypothetical protein